VHRNDVLVTATVRDSHEGLAEEAQDVELGWNIATLSWVRRRKVSVVHEIFMHAQSRFAILPVPATTSSNRSMTAVTAP